MMQNGLEQRRDIVVRICIPVIAHDSFSGDPIKNREVELIICRVQFQEQIVDLIDHFICTCIRLVHLIDEQNRTQADFKRLLENETSLRHRSFG